ncbi:hypothetical protein AB4M04_21730 [Serratia quinivorans]|uniref:Uncharacterized protein n=1 Tax=Serratia quinivorans TaxID=137545 RepID=A0ABV3UNX1_9GAMM
MPTDNDLIKHIVETQKIVSTWPEWKKNMMGSLVEAGKTSKLEIPKSRQIKNKN